VSLFPFFPASPAPPFFPPSRINSVISVLFFFSPSVIPSPPPQRVRSSHHREVFCTSLVFPFSRFYVLLLYSVFSRPTPVSFFLFPNPPLIPLLPPMSVVFHALPLFFLNFLFPRSSFSQRMCVPPRFWFRPQLLPRLSVSECSAITSFFPLFPPLFFLAPPLIYSLSDQCSLKCAFLR